MTMANKVVVLKDGLVKQKGSPSDIYSRPVSRYVAKLFGKTNIVAARHAPKSYHRFFDELLNEDAISIRPHQIKLINSKSLKNKTAIDGKIISKKFYGSFQEIIVKSEDLSLAIHLEPERKIKIGDKIKFCMDL